MSITLSIFWPPAYSKFIEIKMKAQNTQKLSMPKLEKMNSML